MKNAETGENIVLDFYGWKGRTVRIECFEHLNHVKSKPTQRRLKFCVYPFKIRTNGGHDEIYLELTNDKANTSTTIEDFILSSKVTYIKRGWSIM